MVSTTWSGTDLRPRPDIEIIVDGPDGPSPSPDRRGRGWTTTRPGRLLAIGAGAVVAAALGMAVVGVINHLTSAVTVDFTVDGLARSIETRADTVGELLAEEEITVIADDLVVPSPETELTEQAAVEVRHARPLTVTVGGVETVYTTTELTIGAALATIGAPLEGSAVSVALDDDLARAGASVDIVTAKAVALDVGGTARTLTSTSRTVADLLAAEQISVAGEDVVSPSAETMVRAGMSITVTRIRTKSEVRVEIIPHETVENADGDLAVGTSTVTTGGVDGERHVTYAVTWTNDEITSEEAVQTTVISEPVTRVVRVGTKPIPAADPGASAGGAAADLNWAALAQCESSGNPRAVNPAGYYGLYQFSLRTWASVGGTGNPVDASPAEQTERAQILYNKAGPGQWPSCGPRLFN